MNLFLYVLNRRKGKYINLSTSAYRGNNKQKVGHPGHHRETTGIGLDTGPVLRLMVFAAARLGPGSAADAADLRF